MQISLACINALALTFHFTHKFSGCFWMRCILFLLTTYIIKIFKHCHCLFQVIKIMFFSAMAFYFFYLIILIVKAYSDLRNMPFFGKVYINKYLLKQLGISYT